MREDSCPSAGDPGDGGLPGAEPAPAAPARHRPVDLVELLGMAAAVAWIVVVGASYAALFLFPAPPDSMSRAPAPPDLSPAYLPLLAAILILGIIRRLKGRSATP